MNLSMVNTGLFQRDAVLTIGYFDTDSNYTERVIEVERQFVSSKGRRFIQAYCHLRGESRYFLIEQVAFAYPVTVALAMPTTSVPPGVDSYAMAVA